MIKAYIYKILHSALFYLSIAGVLLICSIRMMEHYIGNFSGADIVTEINILLDIDAFRKVITVFAALPFAVNFANEWKSNVTNNCVLRSSSGRYITANIFFCFITAFAVVFIAMTLFMFIYSFQLPLYEFDPNPKIPPFGIMIDKGAPILYLLTRIFIFSFSCAMWSISGLALAALFPDPFVSACTPFIASYLLERVTMQLPDNFNLWYLSLSRIMSDNAVFSFIYIIAVFTVLTVLWGFIFAKIVKRRIANEIV
ncbi:MAG: hypothetical protein NC177_13655 [Ruminococcus flavefaciens]|nr:hypothetical protein [Ruminococcus flavefaciens]